MLSNSCLNCRKNTESKNPKVAKKPQEKPRRIMVLSKSATCDSKN